MELLLLKKKEKHISVQFLDIWGSGKVTLNIRGIFDRKNNCNKKNMTTITYKHI